MYLTYTICSNYHNTIKVAYCVHYLHNMLQISYYYQGSILCTLPTQYAPIIIILPRNRFVYLTYTICSHYHNTTKVAYCVPYQHNMLPLPKCYQGSILCTLPTQYAQIIIILPRYHIECLTYTICSHYHNTTEVTYCVHNLHNMLLLAKYHQGSILCTLPTQYAPITKILPR